MILCGDKLALNTDSLGNCLQTAWCPLCSYAKAVSSAQIPFLLKMTLFAVNPPVLDTKVAERKS